MGDVIGSIFGIDTDEPEYRGPSPEEMQAQIDKKERINDLAIQDLASKQAAAAGKSSLKRPSGLGLSIQ